MEANSFVPGQSWGPPPNSHGPTSADVPPSQDAISPASPSPSEKAEDKPSHDASIFVGSLPCNIDQVELTKQLTEHLSEYAEVKSIKVVRDSKGGICAFVQCENAEAASNLIQILHAEKPKPFMGRILRFEPARAFRTLLISYRAPTYAMNEPALGRVNTMQSVHTMDLPTTMRIWKAKGARFHNIAYNVDAIEADNHGKSDGDSSSDAHNLLLQPLAFDEETIKTMACYFGRIEKISAFQPNVTRPDEGPFDEGPTPYPPPHDAPRSFSMDTGCWEVKWDFRDDCVSALMALRRVPHLTVTWAHQPSYSGWECRYTNYSHFPQATQPTYMLNPPFPSSSSFPVPASFYPSSETNSPANLHPSTPRNGNDSSSHEEFTKNGPTHSSQPMIDHRARIQPEHPSGWNIWRPSAVAGPTFVSLSPYSTPQTYQTISHPETPSTPRTPSSVYPLTPTSCTEEDRPYAQPHPDPSLTHGDSQGSIDPMSLFVGGLEVLGPSAWDEERVRQHFGKYGGLQHVKFVKPFNAITGFAFLKFDNFDGPARAVLEEHNRVCGNHVLRVRLRDCNPPRNTWKQGRGRGSRLFHHNGPAYRKFHFVDRFEFKPHLQNLNVTAVEGRSANPPTATDERPLSRVSDSCPSTDGQTLHDDSPSPSPSGSERSQDSSSSLEVTPPEPPQRYREWYDDLEPTSGSSPNALPVSPSMAVFPPPYPYVFHNVPFYGQHPWVQPYMHHQAAYPMPFYNPYPIYPPVMHAANHVAPPTADQRAPVPTWAPQSMVYPPPYYGVPGASRSATEDNRSTPPPPHTHATSDVDATYQPSGLTQSPSPAQATSTKAISPSESNQSSRTHTVFLPPNGALGGHPHPYLQPQAPPPWNGGIPPMAAVPPHAHVPMHPPPWLPNAGPHRFPDNAHQMPRDPSNRKRQNFKRDGQQGFHGGNRNQQFRAQNNRINVNQGPALPLPQLQGQPANSPSAKGIQPPVWI